MTGRNRLMFGQDIRMQGLCYFDIFPDASLKVKVQTGDRIPDYMTPKDVRQLVNFLCTNKNIQCPKNIKVEHAALIKYVFFAFFEGLDNSRLTKFKSHLPGFVALQQEGFPMLVPADVNETRAWMIKPAAPTLLGFVSERKASIQLKSLEEMIPDTRTLIDNGYPVDIGTPMPEFKRKLRCSLYNMSPLTDEELQEYGHLPEHVEGALDALAIDCEMIETDRGDELARLSGTREDGTVVINVYFKPVGTVVNYRTDKSGITEAILNENATVGSDKCIELLGEIADQHTILIGHSLENDLRAMRLIHKRVIDTALLYNAEVSHSGKPSLAFIYGKFIKKPFREHAAEAGHDSAEDARAAFELVQYALNNPIYRVETVEGGVPGLFSELLNAIVGINVVTTTAASAGYAGCDERIVIENKETTEELADAYVSKMSGDIAPFTYGYFTGLSRCNVSDEDELDACQQYNAAIEKIVANLPPQSVLLVYTGNGNLKRLRVGGEDGAKIPPSQNTARKVELDMCRQGLLWVITKDPIRE